MEALLIVEPKNHPRGLLVLLGHNRLTSIPMREKLLARATEQLDKEPLEKVHLVLWPTNNQPDDVMLFRDSNSQNPAWEAIARAFAAKLGIEVQVIRPTLKAWKQLEILVNNGNTTYPPSSVISMLAHKPE